MQATGFAPQTPVKVTQGTHKGNIGNVGEGTGTGRNRGKVPVEVGRFKELRWINPSWLEVVESFSEGDVFSKHDRTPAAWKGTSEFNVILESGQTIDVRFIPGVEGPRRMHQFDLRGSVSSTGFKSHFVLGVESEGGWSTPYDYAYAYAESLVTKSQEQQQSSQDGKRSQEQSESTATEPTDKDKFIAPTSAEALTDDEPQKPLVEDTGGIRDAMAEVEPVSVLTVGEDHLETKATGAAPPGHLWINQIEVLPEMQQRTCITPTVVNQYREMLALSDPPPVTVYQVGDRFILVDGFHRHDACKAEGRELIPVIIKEGTWEDALLASCTANAYNGQAMTNADKRRATITYLKTLEHLPSLDPRKKQSLREVAKATGASHATVKNIREELEMAVKILQFNEGDRVQVICSDNYQDKTYFRTQLVAGFV